MTREHLTFFLAASSYWAGFRRSIATRALGAIKPCSRLAIDARATKSVFAGCIYNQARAKAAEITKKRERRASRQILDRAGFSYLAASPMAMVAAPFELPQNLDPSTHGAGGAPTDPRAPGVEIEPRFRASPIT